MGSTKEGFKDVFLTYLDIKQARPNWPDLMIEDYLAGKRNLGGTADAIDLVQKQADDNTNLIAGLTGSTGKIHAINNAQQANLSDNIHLISSLNGDVGKVRATSTKQAGKIIDIFHLLAGLDGSNGKLRALANLLRLDIKNINQILGGISGDIGKLNALVYKLISLTRQQDVLVFTTYKQKKYDTGIFGDATSGDFTITMEEASKVAMNRVDLKNETGSASTITIAASGSDTVEVTTLTDTESVRFARRPYGWASV